RLNQRPVRTAAAIVTMAITMFYMISQLVGAGAIINLLIGIPYEISLIIVGILMMIYVSLGGMLAASWLQIIKAKQLMDAMNIMLLIIVVIVNMKLSTFVGELADIKVQGNQFLHPCNLYKYPIDLLSLGLTLILGTARLSHLSVRFFTVTTAQAA